MHIMFAILIAGDRAVFVVTHDRLTATVALAATIFLSGLWAKYAFNRRPKRG